MKVDHWLQHNTFHHSEFQDLHKLVREKEKKHLKVSLCIPTLNEEKTIGKEIVIFKSELVTRCPFLDQLAVIDSGSTDNTREIAREFGAEVYLAGECLPEIGEQRGKGENLWKAVYLLDGDIIIYVDADIKNIHPRFVYGLVAPLLFHQEIKYVKAFYDRPVASAQGMRPSGGGRVTEILIRPLFSLFFPELAAIMQPLSGEYAARREVLEQIPFPIGYGVETSHLLDIYHRWGLEAFGQTDLDRRVHRNQATADLGKMAFGILQTFLSRLKTFDMIRDLPELQTILRQFQVSGEHHYEQVKYHIQEVERPPMRSIDAYRKKYGIQEP